MLIFYLICCIFKLLFMLICWKNVFHAGYSQKILRFNYFTFTSPLQKSKGGLQADLFSKSCLFLNSVLRAPMLSFKINRANPPIWYFVKFPHLPRSKRSASRSLHDQPIYKFMAFSLSDVPAREGHPPCANDQWPFGKSNGGQRPFWLENH